MADIISLFGKSYEALTFAKYSLMINLFLLILVLFLYWVSGSLMWVWIKAWWKKRPVSLSWNKDKQWIFEVPDIPKNFPYMWKLRGNKPVEVRREAIGIAPHKIPMMLSTSEFISAVSPSEINGEHYFVPAKYFWGIVFNDKIEKIEEPTEEEIEKYTYLEENPEERDDIHEYNHLDKKINQWNRRQLWVNYPQHGLNPSEFVKYQKVNPDPMITEGYAQFAELEARKEMYQWTHAITENLHYLIPLVLMIYIGYTILQDHSMATRAMGDALSCHNQLQQCVASGGSYSKQLVYNATDFMSAGVVK